MREELKTTSPFALGILMSVLLSACGGGGSTDIISSTEGDVVANDGAETGADIDAAVDTDTGGDSVVSEGFGVGTGGCVTIARPLVGQKVKLAIYGGADSSTEVGSIIERTITAINDTSITQLMTTTTTTSGLSIDSSISTTDAFTIANNYIDTTSSTSTISLGTNITTTYTPYLRNFIDEVCEGQTLNSTYSETTLTVGITTQHSNNKTVEAVNVPKTTAAGTFNTVRIFHQSNELKSTSWIDIATGVTVLMTFESIADPSVSGTRELIEIN